MHIPNTLKNLDSFLDEMNLDGIVLSGGDNIGDNNDYIKYKYTIQSTQSTNRIN